MIARRQILRSVIAAAALIPILPPALVVAAPSTRGAADTVRSFYDSLTATMKDGAKLGFSGRRDKLAPAIQNAFDLPGMTRLAVGPRWQEFSPQQRDALVSAFADYSAATYARRFTDDSGEHFEIDPTPVPANNAVIVHTQLMREKGDPVGLDYLMKSGTGAWKIVDVFLSGTVSELATQRSEFSAVLDHGGADALVAALRKKATDQG